MRNSTIVAVFAAVALATFIVKGLTTLRTHAAYETANGQTEISVPVHDLHVGHSGMKDLPVQDIPEP
jgi:hypothetical protein